MHECKIGAADSHGTCWYQKKKTHRAYLASVPDVSLREYEKRRVIDRQISGDNRPTSRWKNRDILSLSITARPERVSTLANRCRRRQKRADTRFSDKRNARTMIVEVGIFALPSLPPPSLFLVPALLRAPRCRRVSPGDFLADLFIRSRGKPQARERDWKGK